jgi:hypothetical protein
LAESEPAAIAELLQTSIADGGGIPWSMAGTPTTTTQRPLSHKTMGAQTWARNRTHPGPGKTKTEPARPGGRIASHTGGLTRVQMIAAVLRRHPRLTVRGLIALLDKEFRWRTTESAVTANLYTHRDMFVHTPPDRSSNRPITWSLK